MTREATIDVMAVVLRSRFPSATREDAVAILTTLCHELWHVDMLRGPQAPTGENIEPPLLLSQLLPEVEPLTESDT